MYIFAKRGLLPPLVCSQRLARATTFSAGRQCSAWLSPTRAMFALAPAAGTPNTHARMFSWRTFT